MTDRSRRPSAASVLAFLALLIALGGTAFAATGQLVTIADGSNAARLAKVDGNGKLLVGDTLGAMTVDGNVGDAGLATAFRKVASLAGGCAALASAPSGRALVVRDVHVNALVLSSPSSAFVRLDIATGCGGGFVQFVDVAQRGTTGLHFEPGLVVPAGQSLMVSAGGGSFTVLATGFTVASSAVPASGSSIAAAQKEDGSEPPRR